MCVGRRVRICSELGDDPSRWSRQVPLPVPFWFNSELDVFVEAVHAVANGNFQQGCEILASVNGEALRRWVVDHGQWSGRFRSGRFRRLQVGSSRPMFVGPVDRPLSRTIKRMIFKRDNYRCRYCGLRTISKDALPAFESAVETCRFSSRRNDNTHDHGIVLAFKVVADHVKPRSLGGRTTLDNLVTACPSCNYGEAEHTLEQLGLDDPGERPPLDSEWDGLLSLTAGLKLAASGVGGGSNTQRG